MSQAVQTDTFMLLHEVARLIRVEADRRARVHGMTLAQWGLLIRLEKNPGLSQKELADLLEVEPISVARLVDRLEANGFLERRSDAGDRRIWRLHLLPAAAPLLKKIAILREEMVKSMIEDIPLDVHSVIMNGLTQMKLNLLKSQSQAAARFRESA